MLIVQKPQVTTTTRHTCPFHKENPGEQYAGCTCSGSYSSRDKTIDEMTPEETMLYWGSKRGDLAND